MRSPRMSTALRVRRSSRTTAEQVAVTVRQRQQGATVSMWPCTHARTSGGTLTITKGISTSTARTYCVIANAAGIAAKGFSFDVQTLLERFLNLLICQVTASPAPPMLIAPPRTREAGDAMTTTAKLTLEEFQ